MRSCWRILPPMVIGDQVSPNIYGLAWGTVLGALLHLAVQLPGLRRLRTRLRFLPNLRIEGARTVFLLMGPRVLGLAVVQINFLVNVALAYPPRMIEGSVTVFTYAWTLMFFVLGVVAQSVGTALFPSLSALAAMKDFDGYRERLASAMRSVLFLALPATVGLIVLGEPVIRLIFERGALTFSAAQGTAWALAFLAVGLAGHALLELLSRAFYALEDTRTPVLVGIAAMITNIVLSLILIQRLGSPDDLARGAFAGLALANSVTTLAEAAILWLLLRARLGSLGDRAVIVSLARSALAALGMGAVVWGTSGLLTEAGYWEQVVVGVPAGLISFFGLALLLGSDEARRVPQMIRRRLRR